MPYGTAWSLAIAWMARQAELAVALGLAVKIVKLCLWTSCRDIHGVLQNTFNPCLHRGYKEWQAFVKNLPLPVPQTLFYLARPVDAGDVLMMSWRCKH